MSIAACYSGIEPFVRLFANGSPGARVCEIGPLVGSLIPASPERSLFNTAVFDRDRQAELAEALPRYVAEVDAHAVHACSVWVVEGDVEAESIVSSEGFTIDSTPRAMGAQIGAFDLDDDFDDVLMQWDMATVARLNEDAYGLERGQFAVVLEPVGERKDAFCFFVAAGDQPVACVMTLHTPEGDCVVYFVATDPDHRRTGHATRAMRAALRHARYSGCTTTTLQASSHGASVYQRMGYSDLGVAVNLWERRPN